MEEVDYLERAVITNYLNQIPTAVTWFGTRYPLIHLQSDLTSHLYLTWESVL